MNTDLTPLAVPFETVMDVLPVGVAIVDADMRIVLINPAYCASVGVPPNSFPPGMKLEDALRAAAHRGIYGPGDPEAQLAAILAADRSRPGRLRRRSFQGRSYDLLSAPLRQGGHVVCAVETTSLLAARGEAETTLARVTMALATLRTGLAAFSADHRLLFSNPRFAELLGLSPERVQAGLDFAELLALLAMRDEFGGQDGEAFIAGQRDADRSHPMTVRRVRGDRQVINISSDPLPDGGWTMAVTDISPLAGAEDEARRRAAMLHSIVEAMPHGVCVYSADHRVTMFNRAYGQVMAGAPLNVGDHLDEVIRRRAEAGEYGPGDPTQVFSQQMAFDVSRMQSRKRRRPNGSTVDVRTSPLPDGGYISVVTDITQLTEAEAEVTRRAQELAVMLSCIRHGVLLWGADQRLLASNAIAAELLSQPSGLLLPGQTQDEVLANMLGRGVFGEGEDAQAQAKAMREVDRSKPNVRHVVTRAGRVLDIRSDPTPAGGWVTTYTDMTEERAAADELRRAKEAAETANQAKSRFLATMSHELRTPLNAVIGFSDALLREADNPSGARVAEFAQQINDSGRHLLGLINIILDVARIESGRYDLASDTVDVARLVRHCVRQSEVVAQASEISLTIDVPDDLPLIRADERRLQQVLNHLLSNAVKFTEAGGTVSVGASMEPGGGIVLYVHDTGIGIPADDLERVFEPFMQLDSSLDRRYQGAGLGLYVSRALVAGHGGELTLRSKPGAGTQAEVRLPADRLITDHQSARPSGRTGGQTDRDAPL
jgi:signal transduction histidine kinase